MGGAWTKLTADAWNLENLSPKGGEMEGGSKEGRKEVERSKHFPLLPSAAALGLYQGSCYPSG